MFGNNELYGALNVSAITNELDIYEASSGSKPALFRDDIVPQDFTGSKSINFYPSASYDARLEFDQYEYTINCRGASFNDSQFLADVVTNEINRQSKDGHNITVFVLGVIPPENDQDNYNTPITATLKMR